MKERKKKHDDNFILQVDGIISGDATRRDLLSPSLAAAQWQGGVAASGTRSWQCTVQ